ncbi:MAG TPA: 16S rRNA (cytosine(1402)-N(4))-methyltransferase RsmH [Pyrinomonadaceae bacterium]|jgi:16S rRNA (cytosine1402-N4)-methyltransferase|nr:16S rRNA (cytosine(1402)-N(4))-methyltransferase RsmH [Pyrinomonadaceae bacterium]
MPPTDAENLHKSVLLQETVEMLNPQAGEIFVDCTLGLGGHTEAILQAAENIRVIGIDQDLQAIELAQERLGHFGERIKIFHANFAEITEVLKKAGVQKVNGILADLGVSSLQFDDGKRGFSFRFDAPLDMRMDTDSGYETAAELLERLSEEEIADLIYKYGEERMSRRIARRIVWKREIGEAVKTTRELAETVEKAIGRGKSKDKIHPATRTFQALRIAVNREIEILEEFIGDAVDVLESEGRLAIITFHSLEDRIVKQTFQKLAGKCSCPPRLPQCVCGAEKKIEILTRKPLVPDEPEIAENPRARSAKLRICQKI